ncbi:MAG TPA: DUF4160 domain-containing protein [Saprospiraceae bacterium]|nr:DUF4160 domain-containing protein [Saprospiraceae bacterium]
MPTVLRLIGYRFFFYSNEGNEPPHIHIEKGDAVAKFWLHEVELTNSFGFNSKEINQLRNLVLENRELFIRSWHEHFGQN